jgi:hypothetical protein
VIALQRLAIPAQNLQGFLTLELDSQRDESGQTHKQAFSK